MYEAMKERQNLIAYQQSVKFKSEKPKPVIIPKIRIPVNIPAKVEIFDINPGNIPINIPITKPKQEPI